MTLSRLAWHSLKVTRENGQDSDPFEIGAPDEILFRNFAGGARSRRVATCYSLDGRSSDVETYSRCVLPSPCPSLSPQNLGLHGTSTSFMPPMPHIRPKDQIRKIKPFISRVVVDNVDEQKGRFLGELKRS